MTVLLLNHAAKACLLLLLGVMANRLLDAQSAALRHLVWTLVIAAVLLLVPLSWVLPELHLGILKTVPIELAVERPSGPLSIASAPIALLDGGSDAPRSAPADATGVEVRRWPGLALGGLLWMSVVLVLLCRLADVQLAALLFFI